MKRVTLVLILSALAYYNSLYAQYINPYIVNEWPDNRYVVHGNGTVTDKVTGLMWKQCAQGQSNLSCDGKATSYAWLQALEVPAIANEALEAGYDDWRLPNIKELKSLVARNKYEPAINSTIFPNTQSHGCWSSSLDSKTPDHSIMVHFLAGREFYQTRHEPSRDKVRLVRDVK